MRLVDADNILKTLQEEAFDAYSNRNSILYDGIEIGMNLVKYAETVDHVKHGHWITIKGTNGKDYDLCSVCAHTQNITGVKNYCAVCGAKMEPEIAEFNEIETWNRTGERKDKVGNGNS